MTKGDQVKDEERDQVPVEQTEGGGDGHEAIDVFVHSAGPGEWDSLLTSSSYSSGAAISRRKLAGVITGAPEGGGSSSTNKRVYI